MSEAPKRRLQTGWLLKESIVSTRIEPDVAARNTQHATPVTHHTSRLTYYIWTIGCQMNRADARRAGTALEALGYRPVERAEDADLVILNSCVVRQSAEDKVVGRLSSLRSLKARRPGTAIVLMGCLVGDIAALQARFPHVDLFVRPSDVEGLVAWVRTTIPSPLWGEGRVRGEHPSPQPSPSPLWGEGRREGDQPQERPVAYAGEALPVDRNARHDADAPLTPSRCTGPALALSPAGERELVAVSAEVTAMMGCDRHCTYCLVRLRRGPGRSRTPEEIVAEAQALVQSGVREIALLGQNIDAYGRDLPPVGQAFQPVQPNDGPESPSHEARPTLATLLRQVHDIPGLLRLRFLTSHPADLSDEVIQAVAELPKVCPHWELPVQAGDDEVLRRMGRGYTAAEFLALVERIRARLPGSSIATDVIVGFPGETAEQFERTLELLRAARLDAVHVACYSVRPGTPAARLPDDVPPAEKERRRQAVEALQEGVVGEINARLLGQEVEVLVEELHRGKWKGRTATNKLVFFQDAREWRGRLARVRITKTGPWSLQGEAVEEGVRGET